MAKNIKVSVVLTSYNHAKYLRESIESVLNQTFSDFELFIVDDASTDESWQIIKSYSDPRIRAFRNKTTQRGSPIRTVVSEIETREYIAIHHSDDVWEPQKLEKQVAFLEENPQIGAVFSNVSTIGEKGELFEDSSHFYYSIFDQPNRNRYEWLNFFFYNGNALCHPSVLIRKVCYDDCGLYRYGLAQLADFDMWVRLCLKYEIHILPEKLVRFRVRSSEMNASGNYPEKRIRWQFETTQIYDNYCDIKTPEEFIKVFPTAKNYFTKEGFDIGFALGMVSLEPQTFNTIKLFGLKLLFEALNDPTRANKINQLYHFSNADFVALTAKYDIFSVELMASLAEKKQSVQALTAQMAEKDAALLQTQAQMAEKDAALLQTQAQMAEKNAALLQTQAQMAEKNAALLQTQAQMAEKNAALLQTQAQMAEKDTALLQTQAQMAEKDAALLQTQAQMAEKDTALLQTQAQVAEKDAALLQTQALAAGKEQELAEVINSKVWKIALLFRRIRVLLAPPNSLRARLLQRLINIIYRPFKKTASSPNLLLDEDLALIRSSDLFDETWYLANNPDLVQARVDPSLHYLQHGGFESRDPGPNFSSAWYLDSYEDVKESGVNPLVHYLKNGREEGRHPNLENNDLALIRSSDLFGEAWYLVNNLDVAQAKEDALLHYLRKGGFEGRDPSSKFSSAWYLDTYQDVKNSGINPLVHYLKSGREERRHPNLESSDLALIRCSDLFDEAWYLANNPDVAQAKEDALLHYLHKGGFEGRDPSSKFSSAWYLDTYQDVKNSGINPLVHYLKSGREERRHPNLESSDLALIRCSDLFDEAWYLANNPDVAQAKEDALLHYLHKGGFEGRDPSSKFSSAWYLDTYQDIKKSGINPLVHYLKNGAKEGRAINQNSPSPNPSSGLNPADRDGFDEAFYLRSYPDILNSGMDPYEHYIEHGIFEGRLGSLPEVDIQTGSVEFDPSKDTVLVVSHEASRSGAPILSLNIVQRLQKKYNVFSMLLGDGPIVNDFRDASAFMIGPISGVINPALAVSAAEKALKSYKIKFAIVNSIVSYAVTPVLSKNYIPTISLVHEFSLYARPKGVFIGAALWSSELIFSTSVTHENAVFDNPALENHPFHILPQGRCALPLSEVDTASLVEENARVLKFLRPESLPPDTVLVLGIGMVQIRKGVDLFIDCAARVIRSGSGKNFRFVWIGKGYDPEMDLNYSMYLADQVRRAGLDEYLFFMEETPSIEAAYKTADVLLISSRLDPLPNVAIDAMAYGLPLVCFEKTTGIADILIANGLGEECVAPYLDIARMAAQVLAFVASKSFSRRVGQQLQQAALKEFDMEKYVSQIEQMGLASINQMAQEQADVAEITASGLARLDFFLPANFYILPDEAIRYYVRTWASKIERRKLFPGFHPGIFLEQYASPASGGDPLANYLRAGQPAGPWRYDVISSEETAQPYPPELRIALHLHVYYPDLLPEMLNRLNMNQVRPDLFVSVPTEAIREEVQKMLVENYSGTVIEIQVVPNRGRDIGPFLTAFGAAFVERYDVVGHLHTKKTTGLEDENIGRAWYTFLLENLLGGRSSMADIIIGHLASDPSIGIIFPDDPNAEPYVAGWGRNKPDAEALGQQLGLNNLPENILFPVGTMFWARVESLLPLFHRGLDWQDYPTEPLPYDGSILHALERLLPLMASSQGFRSVLTNVTGITR